MGQYCVRIIHAGGCGKGGRGVVRDCGALSFVFLVIVISVNFSSHSSDPRYSHLLLQLWRQRYHDVNVSYVRGQVDFAVLPDVAKVVMPVDVEDLDVFAVTHGEVYGVHVLLLVEVSEVDGDGVPVFRGYCVVGELHVPSERVGMGHVGVVYLLVLEKGGRDDKDHHKGGDAAGEDSGEDPSDGLGWGDLGGVLKFILRLEALFHELEELHRRAKSLR